MSTNPLVEIRNIRLNKAASLRRLGIDPFPSTSRRTHYARAVLDNYAGHEGSTVTVAGRLMSIRKQGALTFAHIQDQSGRIQLFVRKNLLQPTNAAQGNLGYAELNLLDVGDLIEATGTVKKTERGEVSILPETIRLLTKTIRPLPDQWFGLKDRELILRKRYLDVILDPASKERFESIPRMVAAIRTFLNSRGFLEFNTPVLQPQYGGGTAKPFKTHVNALGCEMYLAISHELYLKRLIAAGYDKVYTIGRYFRNEGIDRSHHPEFSMVETMTAYENYEYNMNLIEEMFRFVATNAFGKTRFNVRGHAIDFGRPWKRISMAEAVLEKTGIDFREVNSVDEANARLASIGIRETQESVGDALVSAFETVEADLIEPTLVYGHPMEICPLAKPAAEDPRFAERFEIFIAGMECGDNWSEQNDPVCLLETWKKAYRPEERDSGEFHALDFDFIEMLEYGMPPTTGIGPGIERMAMIFTEQENIDDVIFFPLMRPALSPINAALYGVEQRAAGAAADVTLTVEDFKALCEEGSLIPETRAIEVRPRLQVWPSPAPTQHWKASGHLEIDGFFVDGRLRIAGPMLAGEAPLKTEAERQKMLEFAESGAVALIRRLFPEHEVKITI
jgi:lysyl-tRNA synthetase, class II